MHQDHIHKLADGRGVRRVFVNGNEVSFVTLADTKKGEVLFMPNPFKIHRKSETIYTRKLKGVVTVEFV